MAAKTIETKAVITAEDKTGQTFQRVVQNMRAMEQAAASASRRMDSLARGMSEVGLSRARHEDIARRMSGSMVATAESAARTTSGSIGAVASVATIAAAHKTVDSVKELMRKSAETFREYDDLVRYQRAVLGVDEKQQKPLIDQAIHLGGSTKFNDLQVLEAQNSLVQRGIKQDIVKPVIEFAANFGQAMNVDLPTAAKALESAIFSTGQNMEDAASAMKNAQRTTDLMVKTAKIGGLNADDITQLYKFGGAAGHAAGFSMETIGALGAMMSRGGIAGSESGVAIRSFSGSLVSPKPKALMAMNALGIDYNKYTTMPGGLSANNLNMALQRAFGKRLNASGLKQIQDAMDSEGVLDSKEKFTSAMVGVLGQGFGKRGKDGNLRAQDAHALAKVVGSFYQAANGAVDVEGLLRAIIAANPSAAQSNAIFTTQQGGRFQVVAQHGLSEFLNFRDQLEHTPAGFAASIGKERMGGYAGASARWAGAKMNFDTALGRSNDYWMTPVTDAAARFVQGMVEGGDKTMHMVTALGAATAALVTFEGALAGASLVNGMAGNAGAAAMFGGLAKALPGIFLSAGTAATAAVATAYGGYKTWQNWNALSAMGDQIDASKAAPAENIDRSPFAISNRLAARGARPDLYLGSGTERSGILGFGLSGPKGPSAAPVAKLEGAAKLDVRVEVAPTTDFLVKVVQQLIATGALRNDNSNGTSMVPGF